MHANKRVNHNRNHLIISWNSALSNVRDIAVNIIIIIDARKPQRQPVDRIAVAAFVRHRSTARGSVPSVVKDKATSGYLKDALTLPI